MGVKLVFLGQLEDRAGAAERDVPAGSFDDVLAGLEPELAAVLCGDRIRLALNGALVGNASPPDLRDGDELAFLPPVSGG